MKQSRFFLTIASTTLFTLSFFFLKSQAQSKANQDPIPLEVNNKPLELPPSMVDYQEFLRITEEIKPYRDTRIIDFSTFQKMSKQKGVMILDTRSKEAYDGKHLKGAIHINFSDFTEEKLAKIIPSQETPILIYCNNNFINDRISFASKMPPLALNIPTFINLYGYGYENIYELGELIPVDHTQLEFEGNLVKR